MTDLPEEFKKQMQAQLGPGFNDFLQALDDPSPVSIRYNLKKRKPADGSPIPWCAAGRYLDRRPSFTLDPYFQAGAYYVQEASSMLIEQALVQTTDLSRQLTVLDLCAAPGGKSTHLLSLLSDQSLLVSNEVIRSRTSVLISNLEKWGYPNVVVTQNDPSDFSGVDALFDVVAVDAPCSGEGLFRKEPEAMTEWSLKNVALCAARQQRILQDVWPAVKPGGILLYSTCTYNVRENHENLRWIKDQVDCTFEAIRLDPAWGVVEINNNGCIGYQCLPHRVRGEGFFISVIRKASENRQVPKRSKTRLQVPPTQVAKEVQEWISGPERFFYFLHGTQIRMLPIPYEAILPYLLDKLHVIQAGTCLGDAKKNKIVPDHALALSIVQNRDRFPGIEVSLEQALSYLRMEPLPFINEPTGFRVMEYDGLGLGWVNILPGRVNNLLPSALRIRLGDKTH